MGNKSRKKTLLVLSTILLIAIIIVISYALLTVPNSGPGIVEIQVTTDKQSYIQGENVTFTIYVNNPNDWQVPKPNSIVYNITDAQGHMVSGALPNILYIASDAYFPPRQQTLLGSHIWNQLNMSNTIVPPGDYTLTVTFGEATDGYGQPGNRTITILP